MNKTTNPPKTVREFFRLAKELNVKPSELIGLLDNALGEKWWEHGLGEVTFTTTPVPHGFTPMDGVEGYYTGKRMEGARWVVVSEWSKKDGFSLTFWTHDDESMTAEETREYTQALMNMTAYITRMEDMKPAGVEGVH